MTLVSRGFLVEYVKGQAATLILVLLTTSHFTIGKPSSYTRRCSVRLSSIVERSPLLAFRRTLGRVSVPVWSIASGRLCIVALVRPLPYQLAKYAGPSLSDSRNHLSKAWHAPLLSFGISPGFPELSPTYRQVAHVLLTRPR